MCLVSWHVSIKCYRYEITKFREVAKMEQICFELEKIEVTYLDKKVLEIDRLAVHQFDRIGIVGKMVLVRELC